MLCRRIAYPIIWKIIRNKIEKKNIYETGKWLFYLVIKCSEIEATEDNYVALQALFYSETAEGFV